MKTVAIFILCVLIGITISAQETGPLAKIGQQMTDYFGYHAREKVYTMTDKSQYRPGETVWFRAFVTTGNNLPTSKESPELYVKLYDQKGTALIQEIYKVDNGFAAGDFVLPETLQKGNYSLVCYTTAHISPEEISQTLLKVDPEYDNQLVAQVHAKDSISAAGRNNELLI